MAKRKGSSKRPQPQHKKQKKSGCISHFAREAKLWMVCYQELACRGSDLLEDR
jgi:hypothetical protein